MMKKQQLLDETVDELTKPTPYTWETDNGTIMHKKTPCLLDQLRDAIENPGNCKTGGNAKSHPNQLNLAALDLEDEIKAAVNKHYLLYRSQGQNLVTFKEQLRSWAANVRGHHNEAIAEAYQLVNSWRNAILEIFNPHTIEITAACPQCNMRYFERIEDGEKIRTSALKANSDSIICTACQWVWDRSEFVGLREKLAFFD